MRKYLLLSALLAASTASMHADTLFNLSNTTFSNGAIATGTVNIDTVAGVFDSVDVTVVYNGTNYVFNGVPSGQSTFNGNTQYYEQSFDNPGDELVIDVPVASLVGYAGGALCSTSNLCGDGYASAFALRTGAGSADVYTLTQGSLAATTPEPSSLILLGTGLAGAAGAARRRWRLNCGA